MYELPKIGHRADQFKEGRKNELRCFRCTKIGHKAQDCQGTYFCLGCKKESHADNFQSCPLFKKYLRKKDMDLLGRQIPTGHVNIGTRFKGKAKALMGISSSFTEFVIQVFVI